MATRSLLDKLCALLNKQWNRPEAAYLKTSDGRLVPQAGHLYIDRYQPGDRKAVYVVEEMLASGGVTHPFGGERLTASEMHAVLRVLVYGRFEMKAS